MPSIFDICFLTPFPDPIPLTPFPEAGVGNALLYTLVRNCRVQDIDPEIYLAEAIRRMPENPTDEQAAALTPAAMAGELRSTPPASIILAKAIA